MTIEQLPHQRTTSKLEKAGSFEEQFKKKFVMEVGKNKEKVKYTHLHPPSSKRTIVLAPGFTENEEQYRDWLKTLYDGETEVYTLSHSRHVLNIEPNGYPPAQNQKVEEIVALLKIASENGERKVDLIGRSDGGVNAALAADKYPELVRNIIFEGTKYTAPEPPGRLAFKLAQHAGKTGFREIIKDPDGHMRHGIRISTSYALRVRKFWREEHALAESDIRPVLVRLGKHGIGRFGIHGTDDSIFPNADLQRDLAIAGGNQQDQETLIFQEPCKLLDGFLLIKGRHHESIYHDRPYLNAINYVINAADARSERIAKEKAQKIKNSGKKRS